MALSPRSRRPGLIIGVLIGIIVLLALGIFGGLVYTQRTQANATATAQAQANASTTALAQVNASATAQAQANATATAVAQANATATAVAVQAFLSHMICRYMHYQTGVNTDKPLTNFGVPQGCVLVLDSFGGSLNGVTWSDKGVIALSPVSWNNGGVMAFPSGIYSGDIFNGEYAIVPEKDNPNPEQVFCNYVQYVVSHGYAFTQAQPLPAWGLSGPLIVAQKHC